MVYLLKKNDISCLDIVNFILYGIIKVFNYSEDFFFDLFGSSDIFEEVSVDECLESFVINFN